MVCLKWLHKAKYITLWPLTPRSVNLLLTGWRKRRRYRRQLPRRPSSCWTNRTVSLYHLNRSYSTRILNLIWYNRRRAANLPSKADKDRPSSTRAAGHGGSSNTMMRLYTQDDNVGLKVLVFFSSDQNLRLTHELTKILAHRLLSEPVVVLGLSVAFVASVVCLHLANKLMRWFMKWKRMDFPEHHVPCHFAHTSSFDTSTPTHLSIKITTHWATKTLAPIHQSLGYVTGSCGFLYVISWQERKWVWFNLIQVEKRFMRPGNKYPVHQLTERCSVCYFYCIKYIDEPHLWQVSINAHLIWRNKIHCFALASRTLWWPCFIRTMTSSLVLWFAYDTYR